MKQAIKEINSAITAQKREGNPTAVKSLESIKVMVNELIKRYEKKLAKKDNQSDSKKSKELSLTPINVQGTFMTQAVKEEIKRISEQQIVRAPVECGTDINDPKQLHALWAKIKPWVRAEAEGVVDEVRRGIH